MANSEYNGLLSTGDSGSYRVNIISLTLGLTIVSSEDEGKTRSAFYPATTSSSSFSMGVVFRSWAARERFNQWLMSFMENTVGSKGFRAAIRVDCPIRNFSRSAVPVGPLLFGEKMGDVTYPMSLNFTGAADPLEINSSTKKVRSYFAPPKKGGGVATNFYPAGKQLKGAASLDGAIYDPIPVGASWCNPIGIGIGIEETEE